MKYKMNSKVLNKTYNKPKIRWSLIIDIVKKSNLYNKACPKSVFTSIKKN